MKRNNGFSLIELLVVVTIAAVLASLGFAAMSNRDGGSRAALALTGRLRERRAEAIRLYADLPPTRLTPAGAPPLIVDFSNNDNDLQLPRGWRVASSAADLNSIPTMANAPLVSNVAFNHKGMIPNETLPAVTPAPGFIESPVPAFYLTNGNEAKAVAVHPAGWLEIWSYDPKAGSWTGDHGRPAA
jgi:prepilin-type N-terminal cleavage/methylation domain-containing protein